VSLNCQLWGVFIGDIGQNPGRLPEPIRGNIVRLGHWVLSSAAAALAGDAEVLGTLASVNRAIAAGLRGDAGQRAAPAA
jgi:flagellar biosynthesis regulator FlaF